MFRIFFKQRNFITSASDCQSFCTKSNKKDINSKLEVLENNTIEEKYDVEGAQNFIENIKGFNQYSNITRTILTTLINRIDYTEEIINNEKIIKFEITYNGIDWMVKDFEKIISW